MPGSSTLAGKDATNTSKDSVNRTTPPKPPPPSSAPCVAVEPSPAPEPEREEVTPTSRKTLTTATRKNVLPHHHLSVGELRLLHVKVFNIIIILK